MRKLIVSEFVTLDGVMEAPGGEPSHPHTNWVGELPSDEQGQYKFDEVVEAESLLLGRVTYESFSGAWPTYEGPFADKMNSMPKHVVSTTLKDPSWNATVLAGDVSSAVRALKSGDGDPILVAGSCTLVHTLLLERLVDELRLQVFPVSIGNGLRVFPDDRTKLSWQLVDSRTFDNGVVANTFRPSDIT
ncbi:MAG: dihydrofolate reductase family protein [Actinomycetota bacterium]|nr:dihydrofolate reductase family protein [Actinomycetota bacterium]